MWLVAAKDQVYGYYNHENRTVLMSSASEKPYQAKWFRRQTSPETDPFIRLTSDKQTLYVGGGYTSDYKKILKHDGADVYITTQEKVPKLTPMNALILL